MKCSSKEKRLGQYLIDHRDHFDLYSDRNLLEKLQDQIIQADTYQQSFIHFCVLELLKYQGYCELLNRMKQWSIPSFPVDISDLRQHGLLEDRRLLRWLTKLRQQWQSSSYKMAKEELIDYGFKSGLFYT